MLPWQLAEIKCLRFVILVSGNYNNAVRRNALQLISWPCRNSWDCSDVIFIPHPQKPDSFHLWTETMSEKASDGVRAAVSGSRLGPRGHCGAPAGSGHRADHGALFRGTPAAVFGVPCWWGVSGFSWTPTAACRPPRGRIIKTVWSGGQFDYVLV